MTMNMLTVDVEDWYHCLEPRVDRWAAYEDRITMSVRRLLGILRATDTRATFFVLGWIAERHPELVAEIHADGHEIASHGSHHHFVYAQSPGEFEDDVSRSLAQLRSITGEDVVGYRAPYFSITRRSLWALGILKELGIRFDSSIFPVVNHRYGIPTAPRLPYVTPEGLHELPVSTYRIAGVNVPFAGGVYFRVLPYAVVRRLLRHLEARGEPIVFYIHPWEIDPEQPRIPVAAPLRLRHYAGLESAGSRLERLLKEFRFGSVRQALAT